MTGNVLYIGSLTEPEYTFTEGNIFSLTVGLEVALVGQTLSFDTMTARVSDDFADIVSYTGFRSSDGLEIMPFGNQHYCIDVDDKVKESPIVDIPYGTPIWFYHDDELVGRFYINTVKREARNLYNLDCISAVGILDKMYHAGGVYQETTFGEVLAKILAKNPNGTGKSVIPYSIDDDVAELPVSGWLPYGTKRDNLYQLIFAYGVNIIKNRDGNPHFTFVYSNPRYPTTIPEASIYMDGAEEVEKPYSKVTVAEHTYSALGTEDTETLFELNDGTSVTNQEVLFSRAPIIVSALQASAGLTIVSANENSAIVTGSGTLTGVPYTHTQRMVSRVNTSATENKEIDVSDCTMVSAINSDNLIKRLYAFYCPEDKIRKITGSFKHTDERCGKAYKFVNAFGNDVIAFLTKMDITASTFLKASAEFYVDYSPAGQAGLYSHVEILVPVYNEQTGTYTYTGTWTVPEDVTEFKVILIGGGTGGYSGLPGQNGEDTDTWTEVSEDRDLQWIFHGGEGGDGGEGGKGGSPANVKSFTVENAVPGRTYSYALGQGGEGGAATGQRSDDPEEVVDSNPGTAGTATSMKFNNITVGSTDDDDAYVPDSSVYEPITGQFFAYTGNPGIRGGKGGSREVTVNNTSSWVTDGEDVKGPDGTVYKGGSTGEPMTAVPGLPEAKIMAYGGNGAGAAVGLDRESCESMNGKSDQTAIWHIEEEGG